MHDCDSKSIQSTSASSIHYFQLIHQECYALPLTVGFECILSSMTLHVLLPVDNFLRHDEADVAAAGVGDDDGTFWIAFLLTAGQLWTRIGWTVDSSHHSHHGGNEVMSFGQVCRSDVCCV